MLDFDCIFFGIQGSGKGTQAIRIAEHFELKIFEMGAELRAISQQNTDLGIRIKEIITSGDLVPDEIIMEMVEQFVDKIDSTQHVLFDGIPRTANQSELLHSLLEKHDRTSVGVFIELSEKVAVERMLMRKRADDTPEGIKKRFENYKASTVPVIDIFAKNNRLITIHGEQTIDEVTREIINGLEQYDTHSVKNS